MTQITQLDLEKEPFFEIYERGEYTYKIRTTPLFKRLKNKQFKELFLKMENIMDSHLRELCNKGNLVVANEDFLMHRKVRDLANLKRDLIGMIKSKMKEVV